MSLFVWRFSSTNKHGTVERTVLQSIVFNWRSEKNPRGESMILLFDEIVRYVRSLILLGKTSKCFSFYHLKNIKFREAG